ncbi:hypothetical protein B0H13DRAFT_2339182 [Mycena leptocephala]|nr:hypothetical protein B0H13DRAFT_2339182 [Mycena leptocephala]
MSVPTNFGALLIGALFASVLAGICNLQTVHYYRSYMKDPTRVKALVFGVWLLDNVHTGFIWGGLWYFLIGNYGEPDKIDRIPWQVYGKGLKLIVLLTALITILVHCFLAHRIFMLSNKNWFMTTPVLVLTLFRLACACGKFHSRYYLQSKKLFAYMAIFRPTTTDYVKWIFTLGLAVSSAVDVLIAGLLVYLFRSNRTRSGRFNHVLDKLILYGLESGSLTCIGTITSLSCSQYPEETTGKKKYGEIIFCTSLFSTYDHQLTNLSQLAAPSSKVTTELQVDVQTQRSVPYDTNSGSSSK